MGKHLFKVVADNQRDWDKILDIYLTALLFGRQLHLPFDIKFGPDEEELAGDNYVDSLRRKLNQIHEQVRRNIHIFRD